MNLVMLPMWVFSGVFFSSERFPAAMQPFVQALPLTALNDALRAVMLDGAGLRRSRRSWRSSPSGASSLRPRAQDLPLAVTAATAASSATAS